jgi:multiple sugar transport system substrate-binding protein
MARPGNPRRATLAALAERAREETNRERTIRSPVAERGVSDERPRTSLTNDAGRASRGVPPGHVPERSPTPHHQRLEQPMRRHRTKQIAALAASAGLLLAACGGSDDSDTNSSAGDESPQPTDAPSESETVNITLSHWALEAPPMSAFGDVIEEFNAQQDAAHIEITSIPFESYSNTLLTQLGAGQGPTLASLSDYDFPKAIEAGLASDLTGKVTPPDAGVSEWAEQFVVDGAQYAVGLNTHAYQLFVNRPLLDELGIEVPTNYEEFLEAARLGTDGEDAFGFGFRSTAGELGGWFMDTTNWLIGAGGRWSDADGNPTVNTPEAIEAVSRMKTFLDEGLVPAGSDAATYRRAFGEGKIPMLIESMAIGSILEAQYPALQGNMEMYPAPFGQDDYLANPTVLMVNSNASEAEQAAAIDFLNYMMQDDVQLQMQETMGGALVAADLEFGATALDSWPFLSNWNPTGDAVSSVPTGFEAEYSEFREIVLNHIEQIFSGNMSAEDGLAQAQAELEQLK